MNSRALPSTPRQGAASRWNKDLLAVVTREQEEKERRQRQESTSRHSTIQTDDAHDQAITISSGTSDEFDEFDLEGIAEEDLAQLEARQTDPR